MINFKNINFKAYRPGKSSLKRYGKVIKLSANESALGVSSKVLKVLKNKKHNIFKYPDSKSKVLIKLTYTNVYCK